MIDKRLYCETFSRLCASEEAKKEVFQMMNEKKRAKRLPRVLRSGVIAAAMTVALAVTAGAADLATGGALFASLKMVWSDGYETRYEAVDRDGNALVLSVSEGARIEMSEDGRAMILCAAGEEVDITGELERSGAYHFEKETESRSVEVDVTGSAEAWEMTETVTGSDGISYTNRITSADVEAMCQISTTVASEADGGAGDADSSSVVTVTNKGIEDITVVDSAKADYRIGIFSVEPAGTPEEP